jgi:hypothetical protein
MLKAKYKSLGALIEKCSKPVLSAAAAEQRFASGLAMVQKWSDEEHAAGTGDVGAKARWERFVQALFADRHEIYMVKSVQRYDAWVATQKRAGWRTP